MRQLMSCKHVLIPVLLHSVYLYDNCFHTLTLTSEYPQRFLTEKRFC